MDEPNSFSIVSVKRLINVDNFGKGSIREQHKTYRITVERTGTLAEMEQLAKEAEQISTYAMNPDVVSDTEEWHKRKKSLSSKNHDQINVLNKELSELHDFDIDGQRTYTTLTSCSFDDFDKSDCPRISSNKNADYELSSEENDDDEHEEETDKVANYNALNSNFSHSVALKSKKRASSRMSRELSRKRLRTNDASSTSINQEKTDFRKQIAAIAHSYDQHQKTLNLILNNQKKIAKALRHHQIPIQLFDEMGTEASTSTNSGNVVYESSNGEQIDLIQIPADRSNPNKFVLKAVDRIFTEPQQLLDLDPRSIDADKRIITIRDAVQVKFGLTSEELATVWLP
ncbi:unnamed protein product, partial [Rotaria sp. Silwood2]